MNTFKQPVEGARYLRTFLDVHVADCGPRWATRTAARPRSSSR